MLICAMCKCYSIITDNVTQMKVGHVTSQIQLVCPVTAPEIFTVRSQTDHHDQVTAGS